MRISALVACLVACNGGEGSLELDLALPTDPALRPSGMTTVTVTATFPGESPISNTSAIEDNAFSAGEFPVGPDVQLGVVLRDVSNQIVGIGEAGQTIDIVGNEATQITIPVRKPFVYAAGAAPLVSYDTTIDPRLDEFEGTVAGVSAPLFTISVGGDRLAVVTLNQVLVVITEQNMVAGTITIPTMPSDATAIPGTRKIAVAHASGISIVDLDASTVATASVGPVDRVTAGPAEDGTLYAYGLVNRVAPPDLPPPMGTCSGASSIVAIEVDNPSVRSARPLAMAVSDIAAAPDTTALVAALPCNGQVARVTGDPTAEVGTLGLEMVAAVPRATVLAIAGNRIWAAGTQPATPFCEQNNGQCSATSMVSCTGGPTNDVLYTDVGATIVVASIPLDGGEPIMFVPPPRRETIIDSTFDEDKQHAQVLKAITAVPLDLVTLPGGQYVSLIAKSRYFVVQLGSPPILPCLDVATNDWLLYDLASSTTSRVRTHCDVFISPGAAFTDWACEELAPAEASEVDFQPTSVGALFGAR